MWPAAGGRQRGADTMSIAGDLAEEGVTAMRVVLLEGTPEEFGRSNSASAGRDDAV